MILRYYYTLRINAWLLSNVVLIIKFNNNHIQIINWPIRNVIYFITLLYDNFVIISNLFISINKYDYELWLYGKFIYYLSQIMIS